MLASLPVYKEESCKQPCDKGMTKGADGHAGISAVPTDLLCKRGCDVV